MMRFVASMIIVAALLGCGAKGPPELTLEQVPDALKAAFASARPAVRTSAEGTGKLIAEKQYVPASLQLQSLMANPDLSDEQRSIVAGATVAVNRKLQELADSGSRDENVPQPAGSSPAQAPTPVAKEDAAAAAAALEYHIRTK